MNGTRESLGQPVLIGPRPRTLTAAALLTAIRPRQWSKNLLLFAALVYASRLSSIHASGEAVWAFVIFCGLSSAGYLFNDMLDAHRDRLHPIKRLRPYAAGLIPTGILIRVAVALAVASLLGSILLGPAFLAWAAGYLGVTVAYSSILKSVRPFDVLAVAGGFVIRAVAGAAAIGVPASAWLSLLTGLAALLIVLGKRRHAVTQTRHRRQSRALPLDLGLAAVAGLTVAAYFLYAFLGSTLSRPGAFATVPFVAVGVVRYLLLIWRQGLGGSPEMLPFQDPVLAVSVGGWIVTSLLVLYGVP